LFSAAILSSYQAILRFYDWPDKWLIGAKGYDSVALQRERVVIHLALA